MMLTRIVPSAEPGTNQRNFKCNGCGHAGPFKSNIGRTIAEITHLS
jgi:hypothetical protein